MIAPSPEDIDAAPEKKSLSAVLVKSLSSERTLAVQAALAEQPDKALVMFVHDCLTSTFDHHGRYVPKNFTVTLHPKTSQMLANAPTSEDSLAMQHLCYGSLSSTAKSLRPSVHVKGR